MQLEMSFPEMVEALERKHGSLSRASRKADIPYATLSGIKKGADPRYSTLLKIAAGLDSDLPTLLSEHGDGPSTRDQAA